MSIEERIVDYENNKEEIDKWIALKGEQKYLQYIDILVGENGKCTWREVDDLCRYDKRILINVFKYMSFFEDYIRAIVWNNVGKSYKRLESQDLRETIVDLATIMAGDKNLNFIVNNVEYICKLRNQLSHNKIMLICEKDGKNLKELLGIFKDALPIDYQKGFIKDINECQKGLNINSKITVTL